MTRVRVVTDSGADLAAGVVARLGITVVPLVVRFGDQIYLDGQLSADELWRKIAAGPHHPGTSQPAVGVFEETFASLVEAGCPVLCLTITSKHSGTFNSAWAAAQRFGGRVRVMDTLSLSLGQGFQVLAAAHAAAKGKDLAEVTRLAEQARECTQLFILLDTIEHIRRGGRADVLIPVLDRVTKLLAIKPVLRLVDGQLSLHSMARSYERGLAHIQREAIQRQPVERLAVVHVRYPEAAERMAQALAEKLSFPLKDIVIAEAGPALSVHGGPKVVGVAVVQQAD
jgi:DegV family protein with EDD domain